MKWILALSLLLSACSPKEKKPCRCIEQVATWSDKGQAEEIKKIIEGFGVQTLFDLSARDIGALQELNLPLNHYIGATAQSDQLEKLRAGYGGPSHTFYEHDLASDPMPEADLVLLWDQLNCLSPSEIRSALLFVKKSGARFVLMAHDGSCTKNHKSKHGEPRPINWQLAPYEFPKPLIEINSPNQRSLALWSCDELP